MQIRVLNAAVVRSLLTLSRCIELMRTAMSMTTDERSIQPIRQALRVPGRPDLLGMMPGYTARPEWLGIKVLTVFESNASIAYGSHQGMVLLFDARNGLPRAMIDAGEITALRTAAATAVATDVLARHDATSLAVFGSGEQARRHLEALPQVREFGRIAVWARNAEKAHALASEFTEVLGQSVEAVNAETAAECDVVCTVTASAEPVFRAHWLRPGQHLNLVGSSIPSRSEAEPQVVQNSRYFCDYKPSALALAGELRRARESGIVSDDHVLGSIGDVMEGRLEGRRTPSDITVFKSLGMIVEDLVAADYVLEEAERAGAGQVIDW